MKEKRHDVIIVGGGIAGLACARRLADNKKQFKLITPEIGGRILASQDKRVNYGAYYVGADYHNVLHWVTLGRCIKRLSVRFCNTSCYSLIDKRFFVKPIETVRLLLLLVQFRREYNLFKKKCETNSQKEALQSSPCLLKLYKQPASDFVKEKRIEQITKSYLEEILHATTFSVLNEIFAFGFLQFLLPFIVPIYEFSFRKEQLVAQFKKDILSDSVISIKKRGAEYLLKTKQGNRYIAKNVVLATQIQDSKRLIGLKRIKKPISAHMFHIKGMLKRNWSSGEEHLFGPHSSTLAIVHQENGTYLFYSKKAHPFFEKYFTKYHLISHKFWNPAFNTNGNVLLECTQDANLYLIGDYNIVGLEDAYITGIYAANQILKTQ